MVLGITIQKNGTPFTFVDLAKVSYSKDLERGLLNCQGKSGTKTLGLICLQPMDHMQKEIVSSSAAEDTVQATNDLLRNILETFKLVIDSKIKPIVWMVTQGAAVGSVKAPGRIASDGK